MTISAVDRRLLDGGMDAFESKVDVSASESVIGSCGQLSNVSTLGFLRNFHLGRS